MYLYSYIHVRTNPVELAELTISKTTAPFFHTYDP